MSHLFEPEGRAILTANVRAYHVRHARLTYDAIGNAVPIGRLLPRPTYGTKHLLLHGSKNVVRFTGS